MTNKNIFSLIALLLILIALLLGSLYLRDRWNKSTTSQQGQESTIESGKQNAIYEYIENRKDNEPYDAYNNDGKIIKRDPRTGEVTVIVSSIKEIYPKLIPGTSLIHIATSADNKALYFTTSHIEGAAGILRFQIGTKTMSELKISDRFDTFAANASPKSPFAVSLSNPANPEDDKTLYVLDFDNDTYKALDTLPAGQTYNICSIEGCLGSIGINMEWLGEKEFQIEIYDRASSTYSPETGMNKAKMIEKRKYTIQ